MWPEPVERGARELRAAAIEAAIHEFPRALPTDAAAATAIGCPLDEIVATSVFICDGKAVAVLIPGDRVPDDARVASAAGAVKVRPATPAEVQSETGFEPGNVAPFLLPPAVPVLMERTLLQHIRVWVHAGLPTHMANLQTVDLQQLTGAETADLLGPRYSSTTDR